MSGINLCVAAGQTVAILGASGSGKSTLLKIVAGLEPPDSGEVLLDGKVITVMPPEQRHFALMFQDFALFPHLNVQDNVAFGLIEQGKEAQARSQAIDMLRRFGMPRLRCRACGNLAGSSNAWLARALVTRPRVLLLDEPFSALDAELRVHLRAEFLSHIAAHSVATLWVTHDEAEARAVAQVGLRLDEGVLKPLWDGLT